MKRKLTAHCIHHTHWDPFWYFSAQDSMVVFSYNVQEMLKAFRSGEIKDFFLDGQMAAIDEYLQIHPEDTWEISQLVKQGKLVIGPFVSQLDPFLCSSESVINNLRLGIRHARKLGKASRVAYLADPFGQSSDFPKIFNQCGIQDFVFTRGVGDIYGLGNEFIFKSNDGSRLLCHVMLSGYGYGAYAFKNKTLFTNQAEDYNKIDTAQLMQRLLDRSTLANEFVFPLGFDQNPIMQEIQEKLDYYNQLQSQIHFKYTNWANFFKRVRMKSKDLQIFEGEIFSPQFHRLHISGMNSARSDIKTLIDKVERRLSYETQPMMSLLDAVGIPFDHGLIDHAWYVLVNCQTHASATHGDETNEWIKHNAKIAYNIATGANNYLCRLLAVSVDQKETPGMPLVVINTLPWKRELIQKITLVTNTPSFSLSVNGVQLDYVVLHQEKRYTGVVRKIPEQMNEDQWFYKTDIICDLGHFDGIAYKTISVIEKGERQAASLRNSPLTVIDHPNFLIGCNSEGITITDKSSGQSLSQALYFEDGGDEGDSYDYDYPDEKDELLIIRNITQKDLISVICTDMHSEMIFEGDIDVPSSPDKRKNKITDAKLHFSLTISLYRNSKQIRIKGEIHNTVENHRMRIGIRTWKKNEFSYAGTQYSLVKRACFPEEMPIWKEKSYFEEPSATRPLLNHVSTADQEGVVTLFTRSLKEYEFIGENYSDILLTLFRSVGFVGLPDLHRRPGRPSGLADRILPASSHQMMGKNEFDFGIGFSQELDANLLFRDYAEFAVDPLYCQNQTLDHTFYPISYFPINPWRSPLPQNFSFASIQNPGVSFGTLTKSGFSEDYILRLFNGESKMKKPGNLVLDQNLAVAAVTDLVEENKTVQIKFNEEFASGELVNLVIQKKKKDE